MRALIVTLFSALVLAVPALAGNEDGGGNGSCNNPYGGERIPNYAFFDWTPGVYGGPWSICVNSELRPW